MTDGAQPAKHGNGHNPDKVKNYVARIEALKSNAALVIDNARVHCREINADIKLVYDEAGVDGLPKKVLRSVVKARELERKAADVRDELVFDDQDQFDLIRHALGDLADLPLGQAAMERVTA